MYYYKNTAGKRISNICLNLNCVYDSFYEVPQIANFMGPTWGPPGSCRPQMGPMLAPWTLLPGYYNTYPQFYGNQKVGESNGCFTFVVIIDCMDYIWPLSKLVNIELCGIMIPRTAWYPEYIVTVSFWGWRQPISSIFYATNPRNMETQETLKSV